MQLLFPDVLALYRLTHKKCILFVKNKEFMLMGMANLRKKEHKD